MRSILLILLLLPLPFFAAAQGPKELGDKEGFSFDLRVDRWATGSGHFNSTGFGGGVSYRRFSLYGAALLGDGAGRFNGASGSLQFFPSSYGIAFGDRVYPYFQYSFVGRWDVRLVPQDEGLFRAGMPGGPNPGHYRTFEHYGGFGAQLFFLAGFYLDLGLGIGYYDSELIRGGGGTKRNTERFRKDQNASFSLRVSLGHHF